MVQIGKLTERLELQSLTLSATTYGENIEVWKTIRIIYATQQTQRGNLTNKTFDQPTVDSIVFYCRYTPLEKKGTRVFYNGQPYKITNVNTIPFREATIIELQSFI